MSWFNDDLDRVDAAVFSSDALESVDNRKELKTMCERWLRAIAKQEETAAPVVRPDCACFPGTCREQVDKDGVTVSGNRCKAFTPAR